MPEAIGRVEVEEKDGTAEYARIDDVDGLIGLVQLGALEIRTWGSRADHYDKSDLLVLDLDPDPDVDWPRVVRAAELLHGLFVELELESFVKTTGGKGLHVCVPLEARNTREEVKDFARSVADALVRFAPDEYVATMSKAKRHGKIFVDYLRNSPGATFVAPYSTRARQGAPIATPLAWSELAKVDPAKVHPAHLLGAPLPEGSVARSPRRSAAVVARPNDLRAGGHRSVRQERQSKVTWHALFGRFYCVWPRPDPGRALLGREDGRALSRLARQAGPLPVGYERVNKRTGRKVAWDDIVKGYEHADGEYVILSDRDIEEANVEASHTLEIDRFVDLPEVDTVYFERPYHVAPDKGAGKAFALCSRRWKRAEKPPSRSTWSARASASVCSFPRTAPWSSCSSATIASSERPSSLDLPKGGKAAGITTKERQIAEVSGRRSCPASGNPRRITTSTATT